MPRLRIPKINPKPKDFTRFPWTEEFRSEHPERIVAQMVKDGVPLDKMVDKLFLEKFMDRRKADMLTRTVKNQRFIIRNDNEILFNINVPFCAWRCFDCKRPMYVKSKNEDVYPYYFDALMKEVDLAREIIKKKCYIIKSMCFTGNLLALDAERMDRLLANCSYALSESCIELGNPYFVTEEKLALLKKHNVTRIIINVLSFNTVTLRKLCRRFEFKDWYNAYKLIAKYGFDTNIEFAVGLMNEKELQLKRNLHLAFELGATNIDLFSRSCKYNMSEMNLKDEQAISNQRRILEFAYDTLINKGYEPYYLYCTEVEDGCFENVGYTVPNKSCIYLQDKIEEVSTVIGCGTDAESVRVSNLKKTRVTYKNPFDMSQYMFGIDEYLKKKLEFFN